MVNKWSYLSHSQVLIWLQLFISSHNFTWLHYYFRVWKTLLIHSTIHWFQIAPTFRIKNLNRATGSWLIFFFFAAVASKRMVRDVAKHWVIDISCESRSFHFRAIFHRVNTVVFLFNGLTYKLYYEKWVFSWKMLILVLKCFHKSVLFLQCLFILSWEGNLLTSILSKAILFGTDPYVKAFFVDS